MTSSAQSSSYSSDDREQARKDINEALEACYATPPTSGAVVVVTTAQGIQFFKLLLGVSALLDTSASTHDIPELLQ